LKLLVDESLAPGFPRTLQTYSQVQFTLLWPIWAALPMGSYGKYAKAHRFALLTKDKDYASLSITWGAPP
jgi:predicted nuclease of predicted toxin-antitoxin system